MGFIIPKKGMGKFKTVLLACEKCLFVNYLKINNTLKYNI